MNPNDKNPKQDPGFPDQAPLSNRDRTSVEDIPTKARDPRMGSSVNERPDGETADDKDMVGDEDVDSAGADSNRSKSATNIPSHTQSRAAGFPPGRDDAGNREREKRGNAPEKLGNV